jgi:hypothetical protein
MSKKKLAGIIVSCVIIIAAIATPLSPRIVTDYSTLLNYLRDSGASIREGREIPWPKFPDMRQVTVWFNERAIWVWDYANVNAMGKGEPAVGSVGVDWVGRPGTVYFYREGRIEVMYITGYWELEEDKLIISLLEDALGKPLKLM